MYAYINEWRLDTVSEEFFPKPIPATEITVTLEAEDGTKTEKVETVPEVPGLVYDEAIEFDFDETPVYEDGKIVPYSESLKKIEDDERKADEAAERAEIRKAEIRAQIGILAKQRDGLIELDEPAESVQAEIDALKDEYAALN